MSSAAFDDNPADRTILTTDDVRRFVADLVGYAVNPGQLWLMFLDDDRRPLKTLVPIEQIPALPDPVMIDHALSALALLADDGGFRWIIFALERWGAGGITGADRRWASTLAERSAAAGLSVAGMVLCTPESVRTLPMVAPR